MADSPQMLATFIYEGRDSAGQILSGSIDAADAQAATQTLENMRVKLIRLAPAEQKPRPKPLRTDDFLAFNQELAHLAAAGLPVEQGLRLIAQDMRSGRLASTVHEVVNELENGVPLGQAFDKYRGRFPTLYGRLIDAGVKANNLPGVLLNLGQHLELIERS